MPQIERKEGGLEGPQKLIFETSAEARHYLQWKREVEPSFKNLVEASIAGKKLKVDKAEHPLIQDFLAGSAKLLQNPQELPDLFEIDERVKKQLKKLQEVGLDNGRSINVFELLRNPDVAFDQKLKWYRAQIEPRLKWLVERAKPLPKETELLPPGPQDTLDPSMDELEKGKEAPGSGFYEVAPFYGGYYKGHVYEHWDQANLKWQKSPKRAELMADSVDFVETTQRSVAGKFSIGRMQPVDLPYGFAINPASLRQDENFDCAVSRGDDGVWYVKVQEKIIDVSPALAVPAASAGQPAPAVSPVPVVPAAPAAPATPKDISLEFAIGKPQKALPPFESAPRAPAGPPANLPPDLHQKIQDAKTSSADEIAKARILCGFVRGHLEYSNESKYNDLYKQNPAQYFAAIWQNKKADCDVANTLAAEALRQAGIQVRMIAGHYVKSPTAAGTALLHGGTGHAWLEAYDSTTKQWARMDATPKGDPDMDEEEQEQDLDQNNEGDYGEQEAELMSDEDLQKLIEKLEKEEREAEAARQTPEKIFAEQAGCTQEEASRVLEKIRELRELKDAKGNSVLQQSQKAWGEVVRKNLRERTVYAGPVTMREGTDLVDPVSAWIDVKTHSDNPTGFEKPEKRVEIEKAFGGFEVYIAADMSGSMNDLDPVSGQIKSDAQRDSVFLFVDSVMSNAVNAKIYEKKLKNPMPVKVCVSVFGASTEIVLPLTGEWGPKEQIRLYRALDRGAGGGTPDDEALEIIDGQITEARQQEETLKQKLKPQQAKTWKMNRFVAVFADGGSDNAASVRRKIKAMRANGSVVFGFGVTNSGRAMEAIYAPDAKTIPDASKLAESGVQTLVETVKKWYNI
jgi:transglutaminase-like putative cysteine protease